MRVAARSGLITPARLLNLKIERKRLQTLPMAFPVAGANSYARRKRSKAPTVLIKPIDCECGCSKLPVIKHLHLRTRREPGFSSALRNPGWVPLLTTLSAAPHGHDGRRACFSNLKIRGKHSDTLYMAPGAPSLPGGRCEFLRSPDTACVADGPSQGKPTWRAVRSSEDELPDTARTRRSPLTRGLRGAARRLLRDRRESLASYDVAPTVRLSYRP